MRVEKKLKENRLSILLMIQRPPRSTQEKKLYPYTTLLRYENKFKSLCTIHTLQTLYKQLIKSKRKYKKEKPENKHYLRKYTQYILTCSADSGGVQ